MTPFKYAAVNKCIYCGSLNNLTDEHIIPLALGGDHVLPKSSCVECNKITNRFETEFLRDSIWPFRVSRSLPSRKKKGKSMTFPMATTINGREIEERVPAETHLAPLILLTLSPPGLEVGRNESGIMHLSGYYIANDHGQLREAASAAIRRNKRGREGVRKITLSVTTDDYPLSQFARLLAKIGLGVAVAKYALDDFQEIYVRDIIAGRSDHLGTYVGGREFVSPTSSGALHLTRLSIENGNVVVIIQLFQAPEAPSYVVVVGKLRDGSLTPPNNSLP